MNSSPGNFRPANRNDLRAKRPDTTLYIEKNVRVLKPRRRDRLRKLRLKSEFALLQSQSRWVHLGQLGKCWQIFLELKKKEKGKEKEIPCLVFASSTKRRQPQNMKLGNLTSYSRVVTAKRCSRKYVKSCCFANLILLLFWRSRCRCRRHWISLLIIDNAGGVSWSTPEKYNTCTFHRVLWNGSVDVYM